MARRKDTEAPKDRAATAHQSGKTARERADPRDEPDHVEVEVPDWGPRSEDESSDAESPHARFQIVVKKGKKRKESHGSPRETRTNTPGTGPAR